MIREAAAVCWLAGVGALVAADPGPFSGSDADALRAVMDAIYRMEYPRSAELCRRLIQENPEDPLGYVFLARTMWQEEINRRQALNLNRFAASDYFSAKAMRRYSIEPDPAMEQEFERLSREAIDRAKKHIEANRSDMRARFLLGLAYQNLVTFNASLRGSWRKAFIAGEHTQQEHQRVRARHPRFADTLIAQGVYEYAAGSVNFFYKMLGFLMGIRGDRELGLRYLEEAARESAFLGADARTLLVLLYTRDRRYGEALTHLNQLGGDYPENYAIRLNQGMLALLGKNAGDAVGIYENLLAECESGRWKGDLDPDTLRIQLGIARRSAGELSAALGAFEKILSSPQASAASRTIARLEIGKTYDLEGRRSEALEQYRGILTLPNVAGSHYEANAWIRRPYVE